MTVPLDVNASGTRQSGAPPADSTRLYQDGVVAGILGAAAVALWFLVVDTIGGRPLSTPTVLGTALFGRGATLGWPSILVANLLAAAVMTAYLRRRHPNLRVNP